MKIASVVPQPAIKWLHFDGGKDSMKSRFFGIFSKVKVKTFHFFTNRFSDLSLNPGLVSISFIVILIG